MTGWIQFPGAAGNLWASSAGMRRRDSRENREELYAELKIKAEELEKEFKAHKRRISHDRSGSIPWRKASIEEKKGGDFSGSNSLRGELYDKYMEKRDARMRTERRLKLTAMNEAKLRAMQDDLERLRGEMQGKVVLLEQVNISGARRRLQKFTSFNTRSSPTSEEGEVDVPRQEEDGDLTKFLRQKSGRSGSEASKRDDALPISRNYDPRKDFPVRNPSSSSGARAVAPPIPRPLTKSTGYSSGRQMAKPENDLGFRKEKTKHPPIIGRKANQSVLRNIVQTRTASEGQEKLRFAKKTSMRSLGYKNSSERNDMRQKVGYSISFESEPLLRKAKPRALVDEPQNGKSRCNILPDMDELADIAKVDVMSMIFDKEEGDRELLEEFSKSVDLDPFLGNVLEQSPGITASLNMENKQDRSNLTDETNNEGNTGKISCFVLRNDEDDLGDIATASNDSHDLRSSRESNESENFESTNDDPLALQSCNEHSIESAPELPDSSDLRNSDPVSIENPDGISTTPAIVDAISYEADADQIQRDIKIPPNSTPLASYSHGRSRKGIMNNFRRFLVLSKKSRGDECSADWLSTTTSEGDDEIFSECIVLEEQARSLHFPVPASSERTKHKGGYASERSFRATRSFFSLSSFRFKGNDAKPR